MAKVTYAPVVFKKRQNPDKSYDIKIRVTFMRKSAYLPTTETAMPDDLDKELEIKSVELLAKLYTLIVEIKQIVSKIDPFVLQVMDVTEVVDFVRKDKLAAVENFKLPFVAYAKKWIATKSPGSARNYNAALRSFCQFLKKNEFDIAVITSSLMRKYEASLADKGARATSLYTASIATIHKAARMEFNDNELGAIRIKNPFEFYKPPRQKKAKHRALSADMIQKLIDTRQSYSKRQQRFIEACLLSFCLMGINMPDMWDATIDGDVVIYKRAKTRGRRDDEAEMRIRLEPACRCIWEKFLDEEKSRAFNFYQRYKYYRSVTYVGHEKEEREQIAKDIGYDGSLTMYCFRHAWASIAYSIGIDKSTINDCLCHVDPDMVVTDIYIKKDWSVMWEANRKVMEKFDWK